MTINYDVEFVLHRQTIIQFHVLAYLDYNSIIINAVNQQSYNSFCTGRPK